jgi:ABC-2 type transport system ATP-binding protein
MKDKKTAKLLLSIQNLSKTYKTGFFFKHFIALNNLNLDIESGQVLGILGPNGAGKTTFFKLLLNLIKPSSGEIKLFDILKTNHNWRRHVGFLPETPYFYPYLTTIESLQLYGALGEVPHKDLNDKIDLLLDKVGLSHAKDKQVKKFSRGMMQRLGIAQSLINDPQLLILDEPMSGLDPMGRKEIRDIIIDCRKEGKTVIFSSHILSDVEMICDNVAILRQGKLQYTGDLNSITNQDGKTWETIFTDIDKDLLQQLNKGHEVIKLHKKIMLNFTNEQEARQAIIDIELKGGKLISFTPKRSSLEELFIATAQEK